VSLSLLRRASRAFSSRSPTRLIQTFLEGCRFTVVPPSWTAHCDLASTNFARNLPRSLDQYNPKLRHIHNSLRCEVRGSTTAAATGPIARTVRLPSFIWVLPASYTMKVLILCSAAFFSSLSSSFSSSPRTTIFAQPRLSQLSSVCFASWS
jgi:hypothetical protein